MRTRSALTLQVGTPWEGHYTAAQIRDMELCLLAALGWRTAAVTAADCVDALLLETSALGGLQWQLKSTVRQQAYAVITHALARKWVGCCRLLACACAQCVVSCHLRYSCGSSSFKQTVELCESDLPRLCLAPNLNGERD